MNKKIIILFAVCLVLTLQSVAQNSETERLRIEIQQVEAEIVKYKELLYGNNVIRQNCSKSAVVIQLKPMAKEGLIQLCNYLSPDLEKIREKNPDLNCRVNYSCSLKDGKDEISLYNENVICPNSEITTPNTTHGELERIRNTREMYFRLIDELDKELTSNSVEIADQSSGLLLKHVTLGADQLKIIQKQSMLFLRKSENINTPPISNITADVVSGTVDSAEKIVELLPGGNKLTNHYLWMLFKSTHEAGKALGHIGAYLDIYSRKSEYNKIIDQLNQREKFFMQR